MSEYQLSVATRADLDEIKELWKICFNDSDDWTNWYFGDPFDDVRYLVYRYEGRIVSMAHLRRYDVNIRGQILPSGTFCGFATHPDHRGKRLLTSIIVELSRYAYEQGLAVMFHSPNKITRHYPVLHFESADVADVEFSQLDYHPTSFVHTYKRGDEEKLLACYKRFAANYSCMVERSLEDQILRINDFLADGGRVVYVERNEGEVCAYAMFFGLHRMLADEIVYTDALGLKQILAVLLGLTAHGVVKGILPADFPAEAGLEGTRRPFSVMNIIDVKRTLSILGVKSRFAVEVTDDVLPWNAGVYTTMGENTKAAPDLTINSGRLMQLLNGYKSIGELIDEGHAVIHNSAVVTALEHAYPRRKCYVFEKY